MLTFETFFFFFFFFKANTLSNKILSAILFKDTCLTLSAWDKLYLIYIGYMLADTIFPIKGERQYIVS